MKAEGIGIGFEGVGVHLPDRVRTNDWWPCPWREKHRSRMKADILTSVDHAVEKGARDIDPEVVQATRHWSNDLHRGSIERRVLEDDRNPSDMAVAAGEAALEAANVAPSDLDLLILHSGLPDYVVPGDAGSVAHRLGLPPRSLAWGLEAGCASFLVATEVAGGLIAAGQFQRALIIAACPVSRVTDYDLPSSVNVGDGAVAAVIGRFEAGHGYVGMARRTRGELSGGIRLLSREHPEADWYAGKPLTVQNGDRSAAQIMGGKAASFCREVCTEVLDGAGYTIDDVDFFCVANAAAWFPEACANSIGIPTDKYLDVSLHFQKFGHLMAASAPLNIYLAWSLGQLKPGDLLLTYSPGVGFIQTALLYRWNLPTPSRAAAGAGLR